jgi:hypothetical protein
MCLHIFFDTIYSYLFAGSLSNNFSVGGSVAKAKEANVSMIKFSHNKCKGVTTSYLMIAEPIKVIKTATILTVN